MGVQVEYNTNFGGDLLVKNSNGKSTLSDFKFALGVESFSTTIKSLTFLYESLTLDKEQLMFLLARCLIHENEKIQSTTFDVLQHLGSKVTCATFFRKALSEMLRSDHF